MRSFRLREAVATTARNLPSRSDDEKARSSSSIFPASAHSRTWSLAAIATTWMRAPVSMSPLILGSPPLPAPTIRHCFPASFMNIGNKLVTVSSRYLRHSPSRTHRRQIAGNGFHRFASQKLPQLRIRVPGKELTQFLVGLVGLTCGEILPKQSLDRIRNLSRKAAISHGPRGRLMQTERSAKAEVIGIDEASVDFHLFAVNANVGNPVLSATVRASGNVQLQVLIETWHTLFQFLHQPAGKALRLRDCQLAELRAAARDGAPPERRPAHPQSNRVQFLGKILSIQPWNVHDEQVLHVRRAQFAGREAIGQIGGSAHLFRRNSSAENGSSHVAIARLLLRMNSHVVAINIRGRALFYRLIKLKSNPPLQFVQETLCRPSMPQEEELQPRPLAMFPQHIRVAKQFRNPLYGGQHLMPSHKRVQSRSQVGFGGKSSRNSQREAHLGYPAHHTSRRGQPNIVDLRIRAPHAASRD